MRGLRSLPVRYELSGPPLPLAPTPAADVPDAPAVADQAAKRRSSLWRYLAGLIRSGS